VFCASIHEPRHEAVHRTRISIVPTANPICSRDKSAVRTAICTLRAGGLSGVDLDLFSEEPVEFPQGVLDRPGWISLAAVAGAVVCGLRATAFVYWTP
jgi:hypothetical protein